MSANLLTHRPCLVLVGGFLGSGKTTLILAASRELERRGSKSAVILNDQGEDLVDTRYAETRGLRVGEITGGCFCCRLSGLISALDILRAHAPDVIFAEPVGSCTDLSATVLNPLRELDCGFQLAPLTVLVDPARAQALMHGTADSSIEFLFNSQIGEADLICFTKADLYAIPPAIPRSHARQLSAITGEGVAPWLDEVLSGELTSGSHILDIDYGRYAMAEAALAWLNLHLIFRPNVATSPVLVLGPLLDGIQDSMHAAGLELVHLKGLVESPEGNIKVAYTGLGQPKSIEGELTASPAQQHILRVNIRALGSPEDLRAIVERQLSRLEGEFIDLRMQSFRPSAPIPERRTRKSLSPASPR